MFKVGDIVIFKKRYVSNITHQIDFITSMGFVCLDDVRGQFKQDDLQHATPEEIAAGHRIDTETLDHISPNCKQVK